MTSFITSSPSTTRRMQTGGTRPPMRSSTRMRYVRNSDAKPPFSCAGSKGYTVLRRLFQDTATPSFASVLADMLEQSEGCHGSDVTGRLGFMIRTQAFAQARARVCSRLWHLGPGTREHLGPPRLEHRAPSIFRTPVSQATAPAVSQAAQPRRIVTNAGRMPGGCTARSGRRRHLTRSLAEVHAVFHVRATPDGWSGTEGGTQSLTRPCVSEIVGGDGSDRNAGNRRLCRSGVRCCASDHTP